MSVNEVYTLHNISLQKKMIVKIDKTEKLRHCYNVLGQIILCSPVDL